MRAPRARSLRFAAKTIGSGSLLAVPAAKERGDRGRGTSAFEMVLSPGAGRASAAGGSPPLRAPQRQGEQVPPGLSPGDARGEAPCMKITLVSPFPAGEERSASAGWGAILPLRGRGARRQAKGRDSQCRRGQATPSPFKNFSAAADIHILFTDIWYTQTRKTGGGMNPV